MFNTMERSKSFDCFGRSIPGDPQTLCVAFPGFNDPRLYVKAHQNDIEAPSLNITTLEEVRYLPVTVGEHKVLIDLKDFMQRFHFHQKDVDNVCKGNQSLQELLATRLHLPQSLDVYSQVYQSCIAKGPQNEEEANQAEILIFPRNIFKPELDKPTLMRIAKVATKRLKGSPGGVCVKLKDGPSTFASLNENKNTEIYLWNNRHHPGEGRKEFIGRGGSATVQTVFNLNQCALEALRVHRTKEGYEEALINWEHERVILDHLHSLPNVPKAIAHRPNCNLHIKRKKSILLGNVWKKYPISLMEMLSHVYSNDEVPRLKKGGLEYRTRLELLEACRELVVALIFLEEVAKTVHGDIKPENIGCWEDADGKLHFTLEDWEGARRHTDYDFKNRDLSEEISGYCTERYICAEDIIASFEIARKIQIYSSPLPRLTGQFKEFYYALQHKRDLFTLATTIYAILGYSDLPQINDEGLIDLDHSFGFDLHDEEADEDLARRQALYGDELQEAFDNILVSDPGKRLSTKDFLAVIDKTLKAAKMPGSKLAKTLSERRIQHFD